MATMRKEAESAPSRVKSAPPQGAQPDRMLRFATRVDTVDALIETFSNLIEKDSLFIVTKNVLPVGLQRRFAVTLRDGRPVLSGEAEIQESPALLSGPGSAAGIRLRLLRLTPASLALHKRMLDHKREHKATQVTSMPESPAPDSTASAIAPAEVSNRESSASAPLAVTPSGLILPANPLSELADSILQGFVECAIFEDYGVPRLGIGDVAPRPGESQGILQDLAHEGDEDALAATPAEPARTETRPPARADDAARPATRPPPLPRPATPRPVTAPPREAMPSPPAAAAAPLEVPPPVVTTPPATIELPVPITVSIGVKAQLVTALLALGIGFLGGYLVFGVKAPGGATPPGMSEITTVPPQPAVTHEIGTPAALEPDHASAAVAPTAFVAPGGAEPTAPEKSAAASAPPNAGTDTCTISIDSNVDDARVLINSVLVGTGTIREQSVPCGEELLVMVEHARYQTFEKRVTTSPGAPVHVAASLRRPAARLTLVSNPPGATISVNGEVIGRSPATVDVKAHKSVHVTAALKGYKVWARRVRVSRSGLTIKATLNRIGAARSR